MRSEEDYETKSGGTGITVTLHVPCASGDDEVRAYGLAEGLPR